MISQLIRVRNAFVPEDHPKAYGYLIGRNTTGPQSHGTVFHEMQEMIIAWTNGTIEGDRDHERNVAWQLPAVFLSNEQ